MLIRFIILVCSLAITVHLQAGRTKLQKPPLQTIILDPGHGGIDQGASGEYSTEAQCALSISFKIRDLLAKELPDVRVLMTREKDELPGGGRNKDAALKYRANFANQNNGDLFLCIHLNSTVIRYERRFEGYRTETYTVFQGKGKRKKKITKTRQVPVYVRYKSPIQASGTQTYIWAANKTTGKQSAVENMEGVLGEGNEADSSFQQELNSVEYRIRIGQYTKYFFRKSYDLAALVEEEFANAGRKSWGVMQRNEKGIWVLQATGMPSILVETGFISNKEEEDYLNSEKGQMEVATNVVTAVKRYKEQLEAAQKHTTELNNGKGAGGH